MRYPTAKKSVSFVYYKPGKGGIPTPLKNMKAVVSTHLKNMSSSVGMILPNIWKNKIHVPNHQPETVCLYQSVPKCKPKL
jgi:hypothetical protein